LGADLPPLFDGLKQAARTIGGAQIQNVATLCGNLCNASPAADGVPALLCLDAQVELSSSDGVARMPLGDYITGNRRTARRADQLMTAVLVPKSDAARGASRFLKLGAREYLVISIAMVAVAVEAGADGAVSRARVAVGACSEVAQRLGALEATLVGRPLDARLGDAVEPAHLAALSPIDDMRASAAYRRDAALTLVRRALSELGAAP
jgi:CO/xanthine dehydrogenase FAD-binding subunit